MGTLEKAAILLPYLCSRTSKPWAYINEKQLTKFRTASDFLAHYINWYVVSSKRISIHFKYILF